MDVSAVTAWLASRAIPLESGDLAPLRPVLDGVRVLGMGEATHGTREFFLLKHRLLEFLVTEMGFTVLAMEASVSAAEAVNEHIAHGTGDPAEALRDLGFWTWDTAEMLDLVEWLRAHNATAPPGRKVRFAGIDPQLPGASLRRLATHLHATDPARADALLDPLAALTTTRLGSGHPLDPDVEQAAANLETYLAETDASPGIRAHARTLTQAAALLTRPLLNPHKDTQDAATLRDRFLADNVDLLLADPAAKVAVWAHNGHVMTGHHSGGAVPAMGLHLRHRHGPAYYALGLLFGQGEFRAKRLRPLLKWPRLRRPRTGERPVTHRVPFSGAPNAVETRLAAACPGNHLVDLRRHPDDEHPGDVTAWLTAQNHLRAYGAAVGRYTYKLAFMPTTLADEYDGLAYVATSTCSTPLR